MVHILCDAALAAAFSFAVTFGVLNTIAWRKQRRLNALLQELCTSAWQLQRWPLIDAWLDYAGMELKVRQRRLR